MFIAVRLFPCGVLFQCRHITGFQILALSPVKFLFIDPPHHLVKSMPLHHRAAGLLRFCPVVFSRLVCCGNHIIVIDLGIIQAGPVLRNDTQFFDLAADTLCFFIFFPAQGSQHILAILHATARQTVEFEFIGVHYRIHSTLILYNGSGSQPRCLFRYSILSQNSLVIQLTYLFHGCSPYRLVLLSFFHRSQSLSRTVVCSLVIIVSQENCSHVPQQAIPCFKTQSRV